MTEETKTTNNQLDGILKRYSGDAMELIPILQQIQGLFGYLPESAMQRVARFLKIPESSVFGVATFYEQFRFTPMGRTKITVCRGTACHVRGAQQLIDTVEKTLGIEEGETTDDQEFTLETAACIGCCALAPCVMIDDEVEAKLTPKKLKGFIEQKGEEK